MSSCPYCGRPMANRRRVQCGEAECRRQWQADRMRAYMRQRRQSDPTYGNRGRKPQPWSASRKAADQRRRARKLTTTTQAIIATEVYERDGWTCGICWQPVDQGLAWPHPDSASLDHIVPLAREGTHTDDNVQLAHLHCNLAKNDRPSERLPFAA